MPLSCRSRRHALAALALAAAATSPAAAQIIELRATINAAQEVPATTSPAIGAGVMLYNVATNTFDLFVTLNGYSNLMTDSHVQEAPAGENGPALIHFGPERVFSRSGATVTATFLNQRYPGDPLKLLRNGAYLNFHSAPFPRGEIRGQLLTQPKRLVSLITVEQERAAFPGAIIASNASGAAILHFNPGTNQLSVRVTLFGFTNALTNSHFHEAAPGTSGPAVVGLGGAAAAGYTNHGGGHWSGSFDLPYTGGDLMRLLTGGAYLNFHSNVHGDGEIRGQVHITDELPSSRLANLSTRGLVGGGQVLIGGIAVAGTEPVRVLITARGPSLTAFGIANPLADPVLTLHDASGRTIATNDNFGSAPAGSELARIPGLPTNAAESALVLVLAPGNYTAVVSATGTASGVALLEATDLRSVAGITN